MDGVERLQTRIARIATRDRFGAGGRAGAEAAIERCAAALAEFEAAAVSADRP